MENKNSNNKRIVKNTIYLYVRTLITMIISLYTSRIILQVLGIDDYGIYNVIGGIATSFTFLSSTLSNATQRYLNFAMGQNKSQVIGEVFNMNMLIFLIYALISVVLVEIGGIWFIKYKMVIPADRIDAAYWVLHSTAIILFISLITSVYESVVVARENMKIYAYMGIYDAVVKLGIVFLISYISVDKLKMYSVLIGLMTLSTRLIPTIFSIRNYEETRLKYYWDKSVFKKMSKFIGWNIMGTIVFILNDQGIDMLLNIFFGPAINAARALSVRVKAVVTNFTTGFLTATRPQIVKSYASGDIKYFIELLFNTTRFSFFLLWILALPVMLRITPLLNLWLAEVPIMTDSFVIWMLLFSLVNCMCDPVWQSMQAVGKLGKYVMVGSIIYFSAFPISWLAFRAGYNALATFQILVLIRIIYLCITLTIFRQSVKFSFADYINNVIMPIFKVVIISTVIAYSINYILPDDLVSTLLSCFISVLVVGSIIILFGVNKAERSVILEKIKTKICKS